MKTVTRESHGIIPVVVARVRVIRAEADLDLQGHVAVVVADRREKDETGLLMCFKGQLASKFNLPAVHF